MIFENSLVVAAQPDDAWKLILNVPEIAPCLPGASLTEQVSEDVFKGQVSLRLGPIALTFKGTAEILERNEANKTVVAYAAGSDAKGRGSAKAKVSFKLVPDANGTRINISTDLTLSGSVAQYGRSTSLLQSVATELIKQFEQNLNAKVSASQVQSAPAPMAATATVQATPSAPNAIGFGLLLRMMAGVISNLFRRA